LLKQRAIKAILFDMGGTIYDSRFDPHPIHVRLLEEMKIVDPGTITPNEFEKMHDEEPTEWFVSYVIENEIGQYWDPPQEFWIEFDKQLLKKLGVKERLDELAFDFERRWDEVLASPECQSCYIDSCTPLFEKLKADGYLLGIISNRFSNPEPRLQADGIRQFFDVVEYSATPGYAKPSPFMLIKAAHKLGINPMNCVYIGDKVKLDIEAARRAEMLPVLITWCTSNEDTLADDNTIVIDDMGELQRILAEYNKKT
jgi:HAD superfamily hydrolase (TIGR01549 family)